MTVLIGCSGWQYRHWRGAFYPEGISQAHWFEHYAERFQTVELNNSFYRLPEASTFEKWRQRSPKGFVMGVKASRYLTHIKRLKEPEEPVQRFSERARLLGPRLGPILLQLPPNLKATPSDLRATLDRFDRRTFDIAVEFRHESWFTDETRSLLASRKTALAMADRNSSPVSPIWRTAEWGYLRFHAGTASPSPCYGRSALRTWARRLADTFEPHEDVYVYFNNDPRACAIRDAIWFSQECTKVGLPTTRVPKIREVTVGA